MSNIDTLEGLFSDVDQMQGHIDFLPVVEVGDAVDEMIAKLDEYEDYNKINRLKTLVEAADNLRMAYEELQEAIRDIDLEDYEGEEDEAELEAA